MMMMVALVVVVAVMMCGRVMSLDVSDCEIGVCLYAGL
jgi:hypothetical protein